MNQKYYQCCKPAPRKELRDLNLTYLITFLYEQMWKTPGSLPQILHLLMMTVLCLPCPPTHLAAFYIHSFDIVTTQENIDATYPYNTYTYKQISIQQSVVSE